jgi:hypothetical protein
MRFVLEALCALAGKVQAARWRLACFSPATLSVAVACKGVLAKKKKKKKKRALQKAAGVDTVGLRLTRLISVVAIEQL